MKKHITTLAVWAVTFLSVFAQQQTVENIVSKYLAAVGGADAWKKINTMKITGETQNSGFTLPITLITMKPNCQRFDVDIQGQKFIDAFDGEIAWNFNPFMGGTEPSKKSDEETKEAAKNMFEDEFIDYSTKGHKLTFEGEGEVEGTKAYKVKMVKNTGDESMYFFDTENFVPIMIRSYLPIGPMKGQPVDTYLSEYQEVEGLIIPHYLEQKMNGQVLMNLKTLKVELNVPLKKEDFSMPKK